MLRDGAEIWRSRARPGRSAPPRVGVAPYSASGGSGCCDAISQVAYYPRRPPQPGRRWHDTVAELAELQAQYVALLEALPDNLSDSPTAEALQAICELDPSELQTIEPPRGFCRD